MGLLEPTNLLLLAWALIYGLIGEPVYGGDFVGFVGPITLLDALQQQRSNRALAELACLLLRLTLWALALCVALALGQVAGGISGLGPSWRSWPWPYCRTAPWSYTAAWSFPCCCPPAAPWHGSTASVPAG